MLQKCSIGCQNRQQILTVNERHMALYVGLIRMHVITIILVASLHRRRAKSRWLFAGIACSKQSLVFHSNAAFDRQLFI